MERCGRTVDGIFNNKTGKDNIISCVQTASEQLRLGDRCSGATSGESAVPLPGAVGGLVSADPHPGSWSGAAGLEDSHLHVRTPPHAARVR